MRTIMRNAVLAAGAILLCSAGTAKADTSAVLEANVPFAFVVGSQTFPAGKYVVQRDDTSPLILRIRGENNDHAAFMVTIPDGGHNPSGSRPVLTFERSQNQYRLAGVWESGREGWDVRNR